MPRKEKQADEPRSHGGLTFLAWLLFVLLLVSGVVNVFTILSISGLRRTVTEMREPVNNYFSRRLDNVQAELDVFEKRTAAEKGKSPYTGDIKKLRTKIQETQKFWAATSRVSGPRWVTLFWKAQRAQEDVEKEWSELKARSDL